MRGIGHRADLPQRQPQPAIERAKADGTDAKWTGNVPNEPGKWTGTNPILRMAGTWLRRTGMADGGSPDDRTPPAPMATRTATSCCPSACSNCCAPPHSEREARFGQIWLISCFAGYNGFASERGGRCYERARYQC